MGKKVCFVFHGNLFLCPYLKFYKENVSKDYDIICWNRDGVAEQHDSNVFCYEDEFSSNNKLLKVLNYLKFRKYAKKVLLNGNYDSVIALSTISAIILSNVLINNFKNRYIIDVRDYSGEKNKIIFNIEKKLIKNSYATFISSPEYRSFLPIHKYNTIHNIQKINSKEVNEIRKNVFKHEKISIGFIGTVDAYLEQHIKLINQLKNKSNIELYFIGRGSEKLEEYCNANSIENVTLIGKFSPEDISHYYKKIDIINNLYGNGVPALDYALSNKLYFSAMFYMPILVCPNTAMEKIGKKLDIAITIDLNNSVEDAYLKIMNYIEKMNAEMVKEKCDSFMEESFNDNLQTLRVLQSFEKGDLL